MMLLVDLLHGRMGCSQAPRRWSLNINGFLTLQSHIMLLFERVPWRGQSPPSWSPESWSCFVFLVPSLQDSELHHVIITAGKTSLTFTFPTSSSLFVSMGSSRAPPLIGSSSSHQYIQETSWIACGLWFLQQMLGWLMLSTWIPGPANRRLFPVVWRWPLLQTLPEKGVCSRHP